jgi:hypothetical protein
VKANSQSLSPSALASQPGRVRTFKRGLTHARSASVDKPDKPRQQ